MPTDRFGNVTPDQPTYVAGIGNLGPDIGGFAKGDLLLQEKRLKDNANIRADKQTDIMQQETNIKKGYLGIAQSELGLKLDDQDMKREEFGWKRDAHTKETNLQSGMVDAAQRGGYSGVIDYLSVADPAKAVEFHAKKLQLDDEIMKNDVMQARLPNEVNQAMFESYGLLGKMGQAVLKAPPEERQNMYDQIKPMVKKINPDAPENVADAAPMFMLGVAQAAPENMLYAAANNLQKAESTVGKLYNDLARAKQSGNQAEIDSISSQIDKQKATADTAQVANTRAQLAVTKDKFTATRQVSTDLSKASKPYMDLMDGFQGVKTELDILSKEPTDGIAQVQLRQRLARMTEKGVMTDKDIERMSGAVGMRMVDKKLKAYLTGEQVTLDSKEIGQIRNMLGAFYDNAQQQQTVREKNYGDMVGNQFSSLVDFNKIPKPSSIYENMKNPNLTPESQALIQNGLKDIPDAIKSQVVQALGAAKTPEQMASVKQKVAAYLAQQPQQQQQAPIVQPQQGETPNGQ